MRSKISKYFGPSTLVTAAFIGPGTITVCTLAGVQLAYSLLWALGFSVIATIILQEMSARLGLITQEGLGAAIRKETPKGILRILFLGLVVGAILIGNGAYEAGNISGAVLGANALISNTWLWPIFIGTISFALLYFGKYKLLERFLVALVLLMTFCFLITAILLKPSLSSILQGFVPSIPSNNDLFLILGLIGTTVVPYNLFLHAAVVSEKYRDPEELSELRMENTIAIVLGGFISILILIVAASGSTQGVEINSAKDLALQLQPLLGTWAKYIMALGLIAAGLTSAITAPWAAALAAKEIFAWEEIQDYWKIKMVWMSILAIGVIFSLLSIKPILIIQFAQFTNALLLPIIASYLLYLSNKKSVLGAYTNGLIRNILGLAVIGITILLSYKSLLALFSN